MSTGGRLPGESHRSKDNLHRVPGGLQDIGNPPIQSDNTSRGPTQAETTGVNGSHPRERNPVWWIRQFDVRTFTDHHQSLVPFFACYISVIIPCLLCGMDQNVLAALSTQIGHDLNAPELIALMAALYNVFQTAAIPFANVLTNRFGRKIGLLIGLIIFGTGNALSALAYTVRHNPAAGVASMSMGRAVAGMGASILYMTPSNITTDYFNDEEASKKSFLRKSYNIFNVVAAGIGQGLGSFGSTFIAGNKATAKTFSWQLVFVILAGATGVCLILSVFVTFETHKNPWRPESNKEQRSCSKQVDIPGCLVLSIGIGVTLSGLSLLGNLRPFGDPLSWCLIGLGVVLCCGILPIIYFYYQGWKYFRVELFNCCRCVHREALRKALKLPPEHNRREEILEIARRKRLTRVGTDPVIDFHVIRKTPVLIVIALTSLFTICGYNIIYYYIPYYFTCYGRSLTKIGLYLIGPAAASAVFAVPGFLLTEIQRFKGRDVAIMMFGAAMQVLFAALVVPAVMQHWPDETMVVFSSFVVGASDLIAGGASNALLKSIQQYIESQRTYLLDIYQNSPEGYSRDCPNEFDKFLERKIREQKATSASQNKMAGRVGLAAAAPLAGLTYSAIAGASPTDTQQNRNIVDLAYMGVYGLVAGLSFIGVIIPLFRRSWNFSTGRLRGHDSR